MRKCTKQNKLAWEYNTYNFSVKQIGTSSERAKMDMQNPRAMLKNYSKYFDIVFMKGGILHYFHDIVEGEMPHAKFN